MTTPFLGRKGVVTRLLLTALLSHVAVTWSTIIATFLNNISVASIAVCSKRAVNARSVF